MVHFQQILYFHITISTDQMAKTNGHDGNAFGANGSGQVAVPDLPAGLHFTAVAAGQLHTVLLRSDGQAVAFGSNEFGQTAVPDLPVGLKYTLEPGLHILWMRVSWVVRKTGCDKLSAIPPMALRSEVFRFFLPS